MPVALPGAKIWENTVPLTTAASPLVSPWFETSGFTSVLLAWTFTTGTTVITMEGSFDGSTLDSSLPYPAIPAVVPVTPAVPATTVAAQNTNAYPVQVVITGGTLTAVVVGGTTVGTAAGTYVVNPGSAISITYSAAPTWAWTAEGGSPTVTLPVMHTFIRFRVVQTSSNATVTTIYAQARQ